MADNRAEYELRLRDLFSGKLNEIERKMDSFEKHFQKMNNNMNVGSRAWGTAFGIGLERAFEASLDMIKETSMRIVELGAKMETTRVTIKALFGGSQEMSNQLITSFQKLAKETPFSTTEVLQGAKRLRAYGFEANELIPTMKKLGDVTSALGLNFNDVVWLYGHTRTLGIAQARVLREFSTRGINLLPGLSELKGVKEQDIHHMASKGLITFKDIETVITRMTSKGGQFYGLMEAKSKTLEGRWERLKDTVEIIETKIGESINEKLGKWLDKIADRINKISSEDIQKIVEFGKSTLNIFQNVYEIFERIGDTSFFKMMSNGIKKFETDFITLNQLSDFINFNSARGQSDQEIDAYHMRTAARRARLANLEYGDKWKTDPQFKQLRQDILKNGGKPLTRLMDWNFSDMMDRVNTFKRLYTINGGPKKITSMGAEDAGGSSNPSLGISSATRNITLNITKLIETVNFTKSYEQSESNLRDMITKALIAEVNNVNQAV